MEKGNREGGGVRGGHERKEELLHQYLHSNLHAPHKFTWTQVGHRGTQDLFGGSQLTSVPNLIPTTFPKGSLTVILRLLVTSVQLPLTGLSALDPLTSFCGTTSGRKLANGKARCC